MNRVRLINAGRQSEESASGARQHRSTLGLDSTRIRRELGYREIVPLDEANWRTIEWERANPPGEFNPHPFDYAAEDAAIASAAQG